MWTYDICAFDTGTYYDYYWQQEAELSLTNRAMLFCKVVDRGIAGRLSENVDKKFTTQVPNYYSAFDTIILLRFYN